MDKGGLGGGGGLWPRGLTRQSRSWLLHQESQLDRPSRVLSPVFEAGKWDKSTQFVKFSLEKSILLAWSQLMSGLTVDFRLGWITPCFWFGPREFILKPTVKWSTKIQKSHHISVLIFCYSRITHLEFVLCTGKYKLLPYFTLGTWGAELTQTQKTRVEMLLQLVYSCLDNKHSNML